MGFRTPKSGFTHYCLFYGVPAYFDARSDTLAGRNVVFDWMVEHVCPWLHFAVECLRYLACPWGYEPGDWQIELRGEIEVTNDV